MNKIFYNVLICVFLFVKLTVVSLHIQNPVCSFVCFAYFTEFHLSLFEGYYTVVFMNNKSSCVIYSKTSEPDS